MGSSGSHRLVCVLLLVVGLAGCVLPRRSIPHLRHESYPDYEYADTIDRQAFISYLDSAAVDDWEGVWLVVGPSIHCYLMVESITINTHATYYTHRIRSWEGVTRGNYVVYQAGTVVGYMGQALHEDVKNIELFTGVVLDDKVFRAEAQFNKSRNRILFHYDMGYEAEIGMRRIYPIRSDDEDNYRVRYL